MQNYVLRGAQRTDDGAIGPPLVEKTITAADAREAIRIANSSDLTGRDKDINALWLTDLSGTLVWSLRLADRE